MAGDSGDEKKTLGSLGGACNDWLSRAAVMEWPGGESLQSVGPLQHHRGLGHHRHPRGAAWRRGAVCLTGAPWRGRAVRGSGRQDVRADSRAAQRLPFPPCGS